MRCPSMVRLLAVGALGLGGLAPAGEPAAPGTAVLDTRSLWRCRTVQETPELVTPAGEVQHAVVHVKQGFFRNTTAAQAPDDAYSITKVTPVLRLPPETPADWMQPGFDDSAWSRQRVPLLSGTNSDRWKLILVRGLFEVGDPAKAGDLNLELAFRGGAVVYLNGREVARAFMPKGELGLYTPAEPYPDEALFNSEGFVMILNGQTPPEDRARIAKRVRRLADCVIPAAKLRKGVNVLAIAIVRAPTPSKFFTGRNRTYPGLHDQTFWGPIGLCDVLLKTGNGAAVVPNTGRIAGRGFTVWNQSIVQRVYLPDYPDPFAPLSPVRLNGARNGTFAGQVVVGDDRPIRGLKVEASDLRGPGTIPASAVQIRYPLPDGAPAAKNGPRSFDGLEESPPAEVPVYPENGGSVQALWITVRVPAEAAPGDYAGTVTVSAEGVKPVAVPLALRVIGWTLPEAKKFVARMDLVQSPETVALAYNAPLWSDAHFQLLDKSFSLLGELATKTVFITCIRRTHLGNEHAMIRFFRDEAGELRPDFSIAEKYLDLAVKHLGPVPGVILYCWEPPKSDGDAAGAGSDRRTYDKEVLITVVDPKTGALSAEKGPAWGTPESKVFWKRLTDGLVPVLKKRGLENSLLFGLVGDCRPTKQAMDDITNGATGPRWAVHSHFYCDTWKGYPMGMSTAVWGLGCMLTDPAEGYSYGWSNPFWLTFYPRDMSPRSSLVEYRTKLEAWMGAKPPCSSRTAHIFHWKGTGPCGLGRVGADFWPVLTGEKSGRPICLAGRYPEASWGQLGIQLAIPHVLCRGKTGPLATTRSEGFREGLQEAEARIYIEKALLDDAAKTVLGEDLVARCRKALDERIRMGNVCAAYHGGEPGSDAWFVSSDWMQRSELLFSLAGEVTAKYGGREPKPNLKPEAAK